MICPRVNGRRRRSSLSSRSSAELLERVLLLLGQRHPSAAAGRWSRRHGSQRRGSLSALLARSTLAACPRGTTWSDRDALSGRRGRHVVRDPGAARTGKGICRLRTDPDALVLRVTDLGEREALLQGQPEAFFSTPHYDGYPYVLVRLDKVDPVELAELIEDAWRLRAPKRLMKEFDAGAGDQPAGTERRRGRSRRPQR